MSREKDSLTLPVHVVDALNREEQRVIELSQQRKEFRRGLDSSDKTPEEREKMIRAFVEVVVRHRRLYEQIATEFGLEEKYPAARLYLRRRAW